jgi:hypothetical protein
MRPLLIVATVGSILYFSPAFAQVGTTMPPLGVTSSLGTDPSAPVGTNGLAPGASTSVTPVPNGVTGTIAVPSTSSGAGACSTLATSPMGTFGSPATYDGGGMTTGTTPAAPSGSSGISSSTAISATSGLSTSSGMPETSGLTGMCGSGSSSITASSSPTSSATTSGGTRAGIPLASYEIGNLGVSAAVPVPASSVPPMVAPSSPVPTMPTVSPATGSTVP